MLATIKGLGSSDMFAMRFARWALSGRVSGMSSGAGARDSGLSRAEIQDLLSEELRPLASPRPQRAPLPARRSEARPEVYRNRPSRRVMTAIV